MSLTHLTGVKIWDSTGYYYTEIDISESLTHKYKTNVVVTKNSEFPMVFHNGKAKYYEGTISANFSDNQSTECYENYDFYNLKYKLKFIDFLHNGKTKYLQLNWDSEDETQNFIIPVAIVDDVGVELEYTINHGYAVKISFNWVQIGKKIT